MCPKHWHPIFKPAGPVRNLGKVANTITFLFGGKCTVIGGDNGQRTRLQTGPKAILMLFVPERRRHDTARGMVPIGIEIFAFVQCQVLDQRLAPNPLALHAGAADGLVRFFA